MRYTDVPPYAASNKKNAKCKDKLKKTQTHHVEPVVLPVKPKDFFGSSFFSDFFLPLNMASAASAALSSSLEVRFCLAAP